MGVLIDGQWRDEELPQERGQGGDFRRADSRFRDRITADGSSGFKAEAGRYHLYVAHGCPWAHRTLIFRVLKNLAGAISVAYAVPGLKDEGWMYEANAAFPDCTPDTVNGFRYLHQAYTATDPHYTGKVTVPTLWDKKTRRIVNNESPEIIRMLNSEFKGIANDLDLYPSPLRAEIDRINDVVYANVNNGVYRCGFARTQAAYDAAYDALFQTLDELEARLGRQRYLAGRQITEADWRLFPTLVRLFLAVQVQPAAHRGFSQPVELYAGALCGARHRSDREGALLRDQLLVDQARQSGGHHSEGDSRRLRRAPRPRTTGGMIPSVIAGLGQA
jgi:putative glutathione S-transferase